MGLEPESPSLTNVTVLITAVARRSNTECFYFHLYSKTGIPGMVPGESLHLAGLLCPLCSASGSLYEFLTPRNIIEIKNIGTHPLNSLEMLCTITLSCVAQGKLEVGLALHSARTAKE